MTALNGAAALGDAWVPGPTANLEKLVNAQAQYREDLRAVGKDLTQLPTPLTREVVIAATTERAWELAEKHLLINYRDEYGGGVWKHPLIGSTDSTPVNQLDALAHDRFLVGNPERVITQLKRFQETLGVDHLICRLYFPGMPHEHITQELRLIAQEVMPEFK